MAKKTYGKKILALVLVLVMCFGLVNITAIAAPWNNKEDENWTYAYYLGQEYLGNAAGKPVKPDPVGYGFQGVITSLTFTDDAGKSWTFNWSAEANGEWRITGSKVSKEKAISWPTITEGKRYIGYCGNKAYEFTLSLDGKAEGWTYANDSSRHANWFYYIRFIREYIVNVYYENETGTVTYNGITYAAQPPLVREFEFLYPNGNIIDDSEFEDGEYTDPVTLLPSHYLTAAMKAQGYEIKYATDAKGKDVLTSGVTISLLGDNILNVYCTLIPPATEDYTVIHTYYTEDVLDGKVPGTTVEVEEGADFGKVVDDIEKLPAYNGKDYTYEGYEIDPEKNTITLIYVREIPQYDVIHEYVTDGKTDAVIPGDPIKTEGDPEDAVDEIEKIPTYNGEEYVYTDYEIDEENGTITIIYERETPEPEVTEPEVTEPEVTEPEVTEPEVTEPEIVDIPDDPVPLGDDPLVDIPDEDVPLAEVPKTGDPMVLYSLITALSGVGLAALGFKKKEE